jgi:hypothetical protein
MFSVSKKSATVTILVYNNPPVAIERRISMHWKNSTTSISVLSSCYDPDGDTIALVNYTQPSLGVVSQEGRFFVYRTTHRSQLGQDSFNYTITDYNLSTTATIYIQLTNNVPKPSDYYVTMHWTTLFTDISVFMNSTDADNDPMQVHSIVSDPAYGTAEIADRSRGIIRYSIGQPAQLANVSFQYNLDDTVSISDVGTVYVSVTNDHKISAIDFTERIHWRDLEEHPLNFTVYNTAFDADGDRIVLTLNYNYEEYGPIISTIPRQDIEVIHFESSENWKVGTTQFTYTLSDGLEDSTGTISVTSYNSVPVAKNYSISLHWSQLQNGIYFPVLHDAYDSDYQDRLFLSLPVVDFSRVSYGATVEVISVAGINNQIFYKCKPHTSAVELIYYQISDGLNSTIGLITINVQQTDVESQHLYYSYHWKEVINGTTINILDKITNSTGYTLVDSPLYGSKNGSCIIEDNQLFYEPLSDFIGVEDCIVNYQDASNPAPITVSIQVTNTPPSINRTDVEIHWTLARNGVTVNMTDYVKDQDLDYPIDILSVTPTNAHGTTVVDKLTIHYAPPTNNFVGTEIFTVTVTDGIQESDGLLRIFITNHVPVLYRKHYTGHFSKFNQTVINVLTGENNDYDPDNDSLTVIFAGEVSPSSIANVVLNEDGNVTFSLKQQRIALEQSNCTVVFKYKVTDGAQNGVAEQYVSIDLLDNIPVAVDDYVQIHWKENVTVDVLSNDYDLDNDTLSILDATSSKGATLVIVDNKLQYISPRNFTGTDTVRYKISDSFSASTGYLHVEVYDNAPETIEIEYSNHWRFVDYTTGITFNIIGRDGILDIDSLDEVTLEQRVDGLLSGNVTFTAENVTFIPESGFTGDMVLNYYVTDGLKESTNRINISITNTLPYASNREIILTRVKGATSYTLNGTNILLEENAQDVDGDSLSLIILSGGTKHVDNNQVDIPSFSDVHLVYFRYNDGIADSNTAIATIRFQNYMPVCKNQTLNLYKGQSSTLSASSLCTDTDNDAVLLRLASTVDVSGTFTLISNGTSLKYTASANTSGIWIVPYYGIDRKSSNEPYAYLTLNVTNRPPQANNYQWTITASRKTNVHTFNYITTAKATDPDSFDTSRLYVSSVTDSTCSPGANITVLSDKKSIQLQRSYSFYGACTFNVIVSDIDVTTPKTVTRKVTVQINNKGGIVAKGQTITKVDMNEYFYLTEAQIMVNDYDIQGGSIQFMEFIYDNDTCSRPGFCREQATPVKIDSNTWRFTQKSDNCQTDRFNYRIASAQDPSITAIATLNVVYTNCTCKTPLDIMVLIDSSGSIGESNFQLMRGFVAAVVAQFDVGPDSQQVQIGIIQFSTDVTLVSSLSSDKYQTLSVIQNLPYTGGGTAALGAIRLAETELLAHGRSGVSRVVLIATDGEPNGPCSCGECRSAYAGTDSERENQCRSQVRYPFRDCNACQIYGPLGCMPCSDIVPISKRLNSYRPDEYGHIPDEGFWRIIPVGIGQVVQSPRATQLLRDISYDPNRFFLVDWSELNTIVRAIGAEACNLISISGNSSSIVSVVEPDAPSSHFCGQIVTIGVRSNGGTFTFVKDDDYKLDNFGMYDTNTNTSRNALFQITDCGDYGIPLRYDRGTIALWNLQTEKYVTLSGDQLYGNGNSPVQDDYRFTLRSQSFFSSDASLLQYNTMCLQSVVTSKYLVTSDHSVDATDGSCSSLYNLIWFKPIEYHEIAYIEGLVEPQDMPTPININSTHV